MSLKTLDRLTNNGRWFLWSIIGIIAFIAFSAIWVVYSESNRQGSKVAYSKAFVEYSKIDFNQPFRSSLQIEKTENLLNNVIKLNISSIEKYLAIYNLAQISFYKDLKKETIQLLEKLKDAPSYFMQKSQAMINLSRLYALDNKLDQSIDLTTKVVKNSKDEVKNLAIFDLALYYSKKNDIEKAISNYKKIEINSQLKEQAEKNILLLESLSSSMNNR